MKGQWFLISAVIVTGVFLSMSTLFKTYSLMDPSVTARNNENIYFDNIKEKFYDVVSGSDCTNMNRNLREFTTFTSREVGALGYLLLMNYSVDCNTKQSGLSIFLASSKVILCKNYNISTALPNIIDIGNDCLK
ncbi:MAG: hypothetical protein NT120_00310 [Candidatus Aenigmarchaeota archaeon]|nr:hypothetical protein [Candidatus Aenigmarchaeota archaeon]